MKHEDAKAIIAYLKSLPRSSQTYWFAHSRGLILRAN